jgi:hypothetical protein
MPAASTILFSIEAVDPHLRDRERVHALHERDAAAGIHIAREQRREAGPGELALEVARDFQDRRPGIGAVGDACDAALEAARVGRVAIPEWRRLQPRGVEVLHLIAGDDAAGEAADAGVVA